MATRVSPPALNQDYGRNIAPPPQISTGAAFVQAAYVTIGNDAALTSERALTAGTNITIVDGGANGAVTINATGGPAQFPLFGDAQDGAVVLDGTNTFSWCTLTAGNLYTMNDAVMASSITLDAGIQLKPMGFTIFTTGTFTINGTVTAIGITATDSAGAGAVQTVYVAGDWMINGGGNSNQSGGAGGTGPGGIGSAPSVNPFVRGMGGNGGPGGAGTVAAGGAGGTAQSPSFATGGDKYQFSIWMMQVAAFMGTLSGFGGGGGGGGGWDGSHAGGGGGAGGGIIAISAYAIAGSGTISLKGGGGRNAPFAGCGGGGGGGGGFVKVVTTTANWQSVVTVDVSGGAGGTASAGGTAGTIGVSGRISQYIVAA